MLIDSHCHLDFPDFDNRHASVIKEAQNAGVSHMLTICTRVRHFAVIAAIADAFPQVWCTVGTHPHNAAEERDTDTHSLLELARHPRCIGIGEAGLDYFRNNAPRDDQLHVFRKHIAAARISGLPLVIHARDADQDMINVLREETDRGAFPFVLHCFSSGRELAGVGVELGGYISFSGIITFPKSDELREIAASIPHDRLLTETDAPYLAPAPLRGQRNRPAFMIHTARVLAQTCGISPERLAEITRGNFFRLFTRAQDDGIVALS